MRKMRKSNKNRKKKREREKKTLLYSCCINIRLRLLSSIYFMQYT